MKMLKNIFIGILSIALLLVVVSFLLPSATHVERSIVIGTPAEIIFNQINNLQHWEKWSPWHKIDPQIQFIYEGPESGIGAKSSWSSKERRIGKGSLVITESVPYKYIKTHINFMEKGIASGTYKLEEVAQGTKLTWSMDSDMGMNPVGKYLSLLMDNMIGPAFERGLNNIKQLAENMHEAITQKSIANKKSILELQK